MPGGFVQHVKWQTSGLHSCGSFFPGRNPVHTSITPSFVISDGEKDRWVPGGGRRPLVDIPEAFRVPEGVPLLYTPVGIPQDRFNNRYFTHVTINHGTGGECTIFRQNVRELFCLLGSLIKTDCFTMSLFKFITGHNPSCISGSSSGEKLLTARLFATESSNCLYWSKFKYRGQISVFKWKL